MIEKTRGIALKVTKYRETSAIVEILTASWGLKSYIINGVFKNKPTFPPSLLQLGSVLDMIVYNRENKNIQRVKELKQAWYPKNSLQSLNHLAVRSFVVEFVQKIMRYEEMDSDFFSELEEHLLFIEHGNQKVTNLPVFFIHKMIQRLGLQMDFSNWPEGKSLDLRSGLPSEFSDAGRHPWIVSATYVHHFKRLQESRLEHLERMILAPEVRKKIFELQLTYLNYHIDNFPHLYTPEIYKQLL